MEPLRKLAAVEILVSVYLDAFILSASTSFYYAPNPYPLLYRSDVVNDTARFAAIVRTNPQPVTQITTGCWLSATQNDDVLIKKPDSGKSLQGS